MVELSDVARAPAIETSLTARTAAQRATFLQALWASLDSTQKAAVLTAMGAAASGGGGITDGDKGDITVSASGATWTIDNDAVNFAKMQNIATARIIGRVTASTGDPESLTTAQATTLIDAFTSSLKGLAPASGGGTTNFLRADGTWAAPPATSTLAWAAITSTPTTLSGYGITDAQPLDSDLTTIAGLTATTNNFIQSSGSAWASRTPTQVTATLDAFTSSLKGLAPASGGGTANFLRADGTWAAAGAASPFVIESIAQANNTTFSSIGCVSPSQTGTLTVANNATTNLHTRTPRVEALVTTPSTSAVAGFRATDKTVTVGGVSATDGGFRAKFIWGPATGVSTSTNRAYCGFTSVTTAPADVDPSSLTDRIGMGWDAADTNIQLMRNDSAGTCTKIDLGASFPRPTTDRAALYQLDLYAIKGTSQSVTYTVTDLVSGATATGTVTTDLPSTTTMLGPRVWMSVGGTSSVIGVALSYWSVDPLL